MKTKPKNFIEQIIEEDLKEGLPKSNLKFRFPPEPNGYLHVGHTKAIGLNFGLGKKYGVSVNLRFDDTNPTKEDQEYVDAIKRDISWLGYKWDKECYSSDYFDQLYQWALLLIKDNKAYVDSQPSELIAEQKGTPTEPGVDSPYRKRTAQENSELFIAMKDGKFKAGQHVLRAKIDMKHPNMLMRDPLMYRIIHSSHQRTGNKWCIYPMYDWTHGESDYIEQISHSLCSLEFKPHRELYDWFNKHVFKYSNLKYQLKPKQREFARLNLSYTIMSKRKLLTLVEKGFVNGWDDPRMPTISGLRRRGYTPSAINKFINTIGVAKRDNIIDVSLLEFCVREDLNKTANRVMAVTDPIKLIISNYKDNKTEWLEAENNPEDPESGKRKIPFSKALYIEREDFKEEATGKYFRLAINKEVRLKNAYIIKAESCNKDSNGNISEVLCTYDPLSLSGSGTEESKRKVKGTLHWVSTNHAKEVEVREYDRLFSHPSPDTQNESFINFLNPKSLKIKTAHIEPSVCDSNESIYFQFQRLGYYCVDPESTTNKIVFNKTVGLRDGWSKTKLLPKANTNHPKPKKAIELIKKLGKKFTNLTLEKQQATKEEIQSLAHEVEYQELSALFSTALKKKGTRIAVMITLKELLKKGEHKTEEAKAFIKKASEDNNELLKSEAQDLA
jgi:glutaminyl-tRNA synthetase